MEIHLISNFSKYQDKYLAISGISDNKVLSVLDNKLNIIYETAFESVSIWTANFHINENSSKILITVITTEIFFISEQKYQGFNTFWYELEIGQDFYNFKFMCKWEKSGITRILSKFIDEKLHWVALKERTYVNEYNNIIKKAQIGYCSTIQSETPTFNYYLYDFDYIKNDFDFYIQNSNLFIGGISTISWDKTTILRIDLEKKNFECFELEIPLKNKHHFGGVKLLEIENTIYAYFWTDSHENCKKYRFHIYKTSIDNACLSSSYSKRLVVDSDFVYSIVFSKNDYVLYKKIYQDDLTYLSRIDNYGNFIEIETISHNPIFIDENLNLICRDSYKKKLYRIGNYII